MRHKSGIRTFQLLRYGNTSTDTQHVREYCLCLEVVSGFTGKSKERENIDYSSCVRFEILTAVTRKSTLFWNVWSVCQRRNALPPSSGAREPRESSKHNLSSAIQCVISLQSHVRLNLFEVISYRLTGVSV
jgi:hypothetical protein